MTGSQDSPPDQDRSQLLSRARAFLASPQIAPQDPPAKRAFLAEKGLTPDEIDGLLREAGSKPPPVPPRTYPARWPSSVPYVLIGVTRLLSWLAGSSVLILGVYHILLLPRLTRTLEARHALRSHHAALLRRLTVSLAALKEQHTEALCALPRRAPSSSPPDPLDALLARGGGARRPADEDLLRCAIAHLGHQPTTEELFGLLVERAPWLSAPQTGPKYQNDLWQALSTSPLFTHEDDPSTGTSRWSYVPPPPPPAPPPPMHTLVAALARAQPAERDAQHTLETLSDLTGYITTRTYASSVHHLDAQEEEIRREIRALKGLVLSRRSFMPRAETPP